MTWISKFYAFILVTSSITLLGCKTAQTSKPNVSNGILADPNQFPSVVRLHTQFTDGVDGYCTGTFITPQMLVTAAHCMRHKNTGARLEKIEYLTADGQAIEGMPLIWDAYDPLHTATKDTGKDLAMVTFDQKVAPAVSPLVNKPPEVGEVITNVGFGQMVDHPDEPYGEKNYGHNTVSQKYEDLFITDGTLESTNSSGTNSLVLSGDSGGPMFNSKGEIIGINVSTSERVDPVTGMDTGKHVGVAVDPNAPGPSVFMEEVLKDWCKTHTCDCINSRSGVLGKWISKLTASGASSLANATKVPIRGGANYVEQGSNFALSWIDRIMGAAKQSDVKPEYIRTFSVGDALDHYFHSLGKAGFFSHLKSHNIDPEDYVKTTFRRSVEELQIPGICGGASCSSIYLMPKETNPDVYLSQLKKGPLSDPELSDLPIDMKPFGFMGGAPDLASAFKCLK